MTSVPPHTHSIVPPHTHGTATDTDIIEVPHPADSGGGGTGNWAVPSMTSSTEFTPEVTVVDALPEFPYGGRSQGRFVFLTTDQKMYRLADPTAAGTTGWSKSTDGADIVANSIIAGKIAAGVIGADELSANIILSSVIKTAETGPRVQISSAGIQAYAANEELTLLIPSDGSDVYVKAEVEAGGLIVTGNAELRGDTNEIASNGVLIVSAGITAPASAPVVEAVMQTADIDHLNGSTESTTGLGYSAAGGSGLTTKVYYGIVYTQSDQTLVEWLCSTGAVNRSISLTGTGPTGYTPTGVVLLGSYYYVVYSNGTTSMRGRRVLLTTWELAVGTNSFTGPNDGSPAMATDGTYIIVVSQNSSGYAEWQKYDTGWAASGGKVTASATIPMDVYGAWYGKGDFGVDRMMLVCGYDSSGGPLSRAYDSTGTYQSGDSFPVSARACGVGYGDPYGTGAQFVTLDDAKSPSGKTIYLHSGMTWSAGTTDNVWFGTTWYNSTTPAETTCSPLRVLTAKRRWWFRVTMPALPDGVSHWRVYTEQSSTQPSTLILNYAAQFTTTSGTFGVIGTGSAPPTSNGFTDANPGVIRDAASEWSLSGDGAAYFTDLDVKNTLDIVSVGSDYGAVIFKTTTGAGRIILDYGTGTTDDFRILTATGSAGAETTTERLRITSAGNLDFVGGGNVRVGTPDTSGGVGIQLTATGSIEIVHSTSPYIDFKNAATPQNDFDARLICDLNNDGALEVYGAGVLRMDSGYFVSQRAGDSSTFFQARIDNETEPMWDLISDASGYPQMRWGPGGSTAFDAVLYRPSANMISLGSGDVLGVAGTQVVTSRRTGWGAPTTTDTRTTFSDSATLADVAKRLGTLIKDLTTHGLIGA